MLLKVMQHARSYARYSKHFNPDKNMPSERFIKNVASTAGEANPTATKHGPGHPRSMSEGLQEEKQKSLEENVPTAQEQDLGVDTSWRCASHFSDDGIPPFTKVQELDGNLIRLLTSVKSRKLREKNDCILLEGKRLIRDAIESGSVPEVVLFSRVDDIKNLALPENGTKLYKVPYKTMSLWSDTSTCAGVMALMKTPPVYLKVPSKDSVPLTVICDNVRDPGNLGAVLRVVAGAGCRQLLITKGCVDLWEPKVLRSSAGAHFHLPIHKNVALDSLDNFIEPDSTVYLADNNMQLANDDMYSAGHSSLHRLVPIVPYCSVDFTEPQSVVLVIGGETEGLSDHALRLACERQGARLYIPLANEIESLNTASALSVILFEIKRQLSIKMKAGDSAASLDSNLHQDVDGRVLLPNV